MAACGTTCAIGSTVANTRKHSSARSTRPSSVRRLRPTSPAAIGSTSALSKQTVGEFAEQWFATLGGHRAATRSRYRAILDLHVLPAFGHSADRATRPSRGRRLGRPSSLTRGLSAASISKHRNVLSQICGTAIRAGAIRANPVDGIRIAKSPVRTKRFLSPAQRSRGLATEITNSPPPSSVAAIRHAARRARVCSSASSPLLACASARRSACRSATSISMPVGSRCSEPRRRHRAS